jgi:hypothetical protein
MKPIKYIGPFDEVEVHGLGSVKRGEVVEAADELVGRSASGTPGEDGYDPGAGLLAQPDNWQSVKPAAKTKEG